MKHMRVKNGYMEYTYSLDENNDEVDFKFSTLAEVGEPYQPWFKDQIKRRGMVIAYGANLIHYPWVADKFLGFGRT